MRIPITIAAAALTIATLSWSPPAAAQFFNGYRSIDPMGVDRPPGPVPNARKGKRRTYKPLVGNYPPCTGFLWTGTRCRLPTGQVCTVYQHGLDGCV